MNDSRALWFSRLRRRAATIASACACFGAIAACSSADDTADGKNPGSGGSSASGGSSSGGSSNSTSGGASGGGGLAIDGGGGTAASGGDSGCEKVDFLFVVDNSVSMEGEQALLVASFPGFITAIENTVKAGSNYHVLVTDTDEWGRCDTANPWTGMNPGSSTCNAYIKQTTFEECDRTRGAGVVHPAGEHASNKPCGFPAGRRFLQEGDPNISSTFACAAQVGVAGHPSERPMDSMVAALSAAQNGAGGCNEGFLRDDAVLVITFISDDPNYEDSGDAQAWYDAVVQAKKGNPDAVVVVGLTPAFPNCGGNGTPKGSHWAEFVAKFKYSLHASVCSADYASIFSQAIQLIDDSCDQYVPPPVQ